MAELDKINVEIDDEENKRVEFGIRSGNVFLIEASEEMFKDCDGGSYFLQCLWMYERILRQKLSMNKKDWMGMILFSTKKNDPETANIYTILKFNPVTKEMLSDLHEFMTNDFNINLWCCKNNYPLSNALLQSARCFDSVKVGMITKNVNLITCQDNPLINNNQERYKAHIIAKNYKDIHVKIQIVGLGPRFNYNLFYKELIILAEKYPDQENKKIELYDLEENVLRKAFVIGHMNFKINNNFKIKVSIQGFSTNRRYIPKVWMNKETNEILEKVSFYKNLNDDNDEEIKDIFEQNIRLRQKFGDNTMITFTQKEIIETRHIIERGIELLGFKNKNEEYLYLHVKEPLFIGCNSDASNSEKEFFASLLKQCIENKVIGICLMATRDDLPPYLYSMWPYEDYGGFYLYKIPYKEHVRNVDDLTKDFIFNDDLPFTKDNLDLMTDIVKKTRIIYDSSLFENPNQTKSRRFIETIALAEEWKPELFYDTTLPNMDIMRERLQKKQLITKFNEMFPIEIDDFVETTRKYPCYSRDEALNMIKGILSRHTVAVLKGILKALDLSILGRKGELIERIENYKRNN